jgi:protein TonB
VKRSFWIFCSGLICFFVVFSAAQAQESAVLKPASDSFAEQSPFLLPFSLTVTSNGELVPEPGPVFTEGGDYEGISFPYLLSEPEPIPYPRWAVDQGWQGKVVIAVEILLDGTVGRTQIMQSTGYSLLDETADKALKTWRFHPATKDGQPVLQCFEIPIRFRISKAS